MSKIDDVARGLLIDAFITYAAICREKGYTGEHAFDSWTDALSGMIDRVNNTVQREGIIADAVLGDDVSNDDEHVEALIEERRGLIRDTMREEMADLETASPPAEDAEGIRDGEQG